MKIKHASAQPLAEKLTLREIEVLTLTAQGKRRTEVATALNISDETVKAYLTRACRKLSAVNKTQAVVIALTLKLIAPYKDLEKPSPVEKHVVPQTGNRK